MEPTNEPTWLDTDLGGEQGLPIGTLPVTDALFQIDNLGYGFSLPAVGNVYSEPVLFPNLQCFGINGAPRTKSRVSLACIPCRSRHTRCDAIMPTCSQCRASNKSCTYTQSRRGRVKLARVARREPSWKDDESSVIEVPRGINNRSSSSNDDVSSASITDNGRSEEHSPIGLPNTPAGSASRALDSPKLLDIYYSSFHHSHPIILPQKFFIRRLQTNRQSLLQLLPVMEFIGSLYEPKACKEELRIQVESLLQSEDLPETGFTVQALQLYAVAIHSCDEFEHARAILDRAIQIAVQINMRSSSFATENGEGDSVLEESWRRTWWDLFVIDGSFAAIRHCSAFSMNEILSDVHLPCEEADYQSGDIPQPRTLEDYSAREFSGEELVFSSFAYLIDLSQILGSLLMLGTEPGEPFDREAVAADAALMNWFLYLPKQKRLLVEEPGEVDHILLQAHLAYYTQMVYLHRPRSQLTYGSVERTSKCAPPPSDKSVEEQQRSYDFHTTKLLDASDSAIGLFTLPCPFIKYSPIIICSLTLSILAQVAACRLKPKGVVYNAARARIRLGLAVIKSLSDVWAVAQRTVTEVQFIAREGLSIPKLATTSSSGKMVT